MTSPALAEALAFAGERRTKAAAELREASRVLRGLVAEGLAAGLSQRAIADLTGLSYGRVGHLARFENGDWRRGRRREELKE